LLLDWLESEYQGRLFEGVAAAAAERGASVLCFAGGALRSPHLHGSERNLVYELAGPANVDGLIVLSGALVNMVGQQRLARYLERYKPLPLASIGVALPTIPSVLVDNAAGMRAALLHLIEVHGHRRIAFIRGPGVNEEAERRYRVYREVLAEHGLALNLALITMGDFGQASGIAAVRTLLDERRLALDAIVAASDTMAIGATEALLARGLNVPRDVAVVGFDDLVAARFASVPLTTVRQPLTTLGACAVELLLSQLNGEVAVSQTLLDAELVVRQSCGCAPSVETGGARPELASTAPTLVEGLRRALPALVVEIEQALRPLPRDFDRALVARWVEAFTDELSSPGEAFVTALDEALRAWTARDVAVEAWQHALALLRSYTSCWAEAGPEMYQRSERLLQQAQLLIGYARERVQAQKHIRVDRWATLARRLGESLSNVSDAPHLRAALDAHLPQLGISTCHVGLFDGPQRAQLRTLYALSIESPERAAETLDGLFPAEQLFPDTAVPARCQTLLVQPLSTDTQRLGVLVTELGPISGFLYELLRDHVSAALKTLHLHERIAHEVSRRELAELEQHHAEESIAAQLQTWTLPQDAEIDGLRVAAAMLPARSPGGSYYDVIQTNGQSWIAFGDVTGAGLTTSFIAVMLQSVVSTIIRRGHDDGPASVIVAAMEVLSETVQRRSAQAEQVALAVMRYEPSGGLTFAQAGQDIVVYRAASRQCEVLEAVSAALGSESGASLTNRKTTLRDGDVVLLCSAGILLAESRFGEVFGRDGLVRELGGIQDEPVEVMLEHLIETVRAWEPQQRDDVTLLVARHGATS
jgi:DNA-binding LacI/PurR family transcriptional regulator/serine phosphatase RsbU (regulator of sigma subunit)